MGEDEQEDERDDAKGDPAFCGRGVVHQLVDRIGEEPTEAHPKGEGDRERDHVRDDEAQIGHPMDRRDGECRAAESCDVACEEDDEHAVLGDVRFDPRATCLGHDAFDPTPFVNGRPDLARDHEKRAIAEKDPDRERQDRQPEIGDSALREDRARDHYDILGQRQTQPSSHQGCGHQAVGPMLDEERDSFFHA